MLCIAEHFKIRYIMLVERLYESVDGTIATTMQFASDAINRDAGCTCNDLSAIMLRYFLRMERFERKWLVAMQVFLLECLEDLRARKFLAAFIGKIFDNLAEFS